MKCSVLVCASVICTVLLTHILLIWKFQSIVFFAAMKKSLLDFISYFRQFRGDWLVMSSLSLFSKENTINRQLRPSDEIANWHWSYLAVCAITRYQALYIEEWVEYHRRMGVEKFYIFDDSSDSPDQFNALFEKYIQTGIVEYFYITTPKLPNSQSYAYDLCLVKYRERHQFMAFIDLDEYIVVKAPNTSIPHILRRYEQYGGLTLNWMYFSSSGHLTRPAGGVLGNYWKCHPNEHIKSIVNLKYTSTTGYSPHAFEYYIGHYAVDTRFQQIVETYNTVTPALFKVMYINHYVTRSREEFSLKSERGSADGGKRDLEFFDEIERLCKAKCSALIMPEKILPWKYNRSEKYKQWKKKNQYELVGIIQRFWWSSQAG